MNAGVVFSRLSGMFLSIFTDKMTDILDSHDMAKKFCNKL